LGEICNPKRCKRKGQIGLVSFHPETPSPLAGEGRGEGEQKSKQKLEFESFFLKVFHRPGMVGDFYFFYIIRANKFGTRMNLLQFI